MQCHGELGRGDPAGIAGPTQGMELQILLHSLAHLLYPCSAFVKSASHSSVCESGGLGKISKSCRAVGRMQTLDSAQLLAVC